MSITLKVVYNDDKYEEFELEEGSTLDFPTGEWFIFQTVDGEAMFHARNVRSCQLIEIPEDLAEPRQTDE